MTGKDNDNSYRLGVLLSLVGTDVFIEMAVDTLSRRVPLYVPCSDLSDAVEHLIQKEHEYCSRKLNSCCVLRLEKWNVAFILAERYCDKLSALALAAIPEADACIVVSELDSGVLRFRTEDPALITCLDGYGPVLKTGDGLYEMHYRGQFLQKVICAIVQLTEEKKLGKEED